MELHKLINSCSKASAGF